MPGLAYDSATGKLSAPAGATTATKSPVSSPTPGSGKGLFYDSATGKLSSTPAPTPAPIAAPAVTVPPVSSNPFFKPYVDPLGPMKTAPGIQTFDNPDAVSGSVPPQNLNFPIGPSQSDIASVNSKAATLKISSDYLTNNKPTAKSTSQQVQDYNTQVDQHNSNLSDYNSLYSKVNGQQNTENSVFSKAAAYNAGNQQVTTDVTGESPTARSFDNTLANSTIVGQLYGLVNNTPGQNANNKQDVADFAQAHPALSTVAHVLGFTTDLIMTNALVAPLGIADATTSGVKSALGGAQYLNPTGIKALDTVGQAAVDNVGNMVKSGSVYTAQSLLSTGLQQAQDQKFDPKALAENAASAFAMGAAMGTGEGAESRLTRGLISSSAVAALSTTEKLIMSGKLTAKDWIDIGVNATVAGLFSAFTGDSADVVTRQRTAELTFDNQIAQYRNADPSLTYEEGKQAAALQNALAYSRLTGVQMSPELMKQALSGLIDIPVKPTTEMTAVLSDIPKSFKTLPAEERVKIISEVSAKVSEGETFGQAVSEVVPDAKAPTLKGFVPSSGTPAEQMAKANGNVAAHFQAPVGTQSQQIAQANGMIPNHFVAPATPQTVYHGTKAPITSIKQADALQYGDPGALYGPGLYLTDNQAVAQGYATTKGKGITGQVLSGQLNEKANLLNLDQVAPANVAKVFEDSANHIIDKYGSGEPLDFTGKTGAQIIKEYKQVLADVGFTKDDANEFLTGTQSNLEDLGYNGYRHVGGKTFGKDYGAHNVTILFDTGGKTAAVDQLTPTNYYKPSTLSPADQQRESFMLTQKPTQAPAEQKPLNLVPKRDILSKPANTPVTPEQRAQALADERANTTRDMFSKKDLKQINEEGDRFTETGMEARYKLFRVAYNRNYGKNFEDAAQFIKRDPANARLLYSQEHSNSEVFDMFKDRMQGKSSVMLHNELVPLLNEFVKQDVAPGVVTVAKALVDLYRSVRNVIVPSSGINPETLTAVRQMLSGNRKFEYIMKKAMRSAEQMFDKMTPEENTDFIDRVKRGEKQSTPALQAFVDNFYTPQDKALWDEAKSVGINVDWIDNHLRVLWKTPPGAKPGMMAQIFGVGKSLTGSKGFMKQHTLPDMSTGIKMGGVPVTYNPARMINLAWTDMNRYITFKRFWNTSIANKSVEFLPLGKTVPEGKATFSQNVARQLGARSGVFIGEKPVVRIINNIMSKDYIRQSGAGKLWFQAKNIHTGIELTASLFHPMLITGEGIASKLGLGFQKIANSASRLALSGVYKVDPINIKTEIKTILSGIKDVVTSPLAPYTSTKLGNRAIKSIAGKPDALTGKDFLTATKEFLATSTGKWLADTYPQHVDLISDLFGQGLLPEMPAAYRVKSLEAMKSNIYSGNAIGGVLRGVPLVIQYAMMPTFDIYIPRITWGTALQQYAFSIETNAGRLANGQITRGELARKVVDSIYNRMGEMNWDNVMWNNTFKAAMQGIFRSVTFKGGTFKEIGDAPGEQAREFYNAYKEHRAPQLSNKLAHIMALILMGVIIGEVMKKLATGKGGLIHRLKTGENINQLKDIIYPIIDDLGDRVSLPTYLTAVYSTYRNPLASISNSFTGILGKLIENWQNKDFYSNQIYDPSDPAWLRYTKEMWNLSPSNFSISSYQNQPTQFGKYASFAGLVKAPAYVTNTDMQNKIYDLYNQRFGGGIKSALQTQKADISKQYKNLVKGGNLQAAAELKATAIADGTYTTRGFGMIETNLKTGTDKVLFDRLPQDDKDNLIKQMTPAEQTYYTTSSSAGSTSGRGGGRSGRGGGRSSGR